MKLLDKNFNTAYLCLGLMTAIAGLSIPGTAEAKRHAAALTPPVNGPAADYPVTIGEPYEVHGVTYTPADVWNYDQVGYVVLDSAGGNSATVSDHTLPIPSYVEVTSLETGKTILARVERRGPMDSNSLVGLSPGAAQQLGATTGTPVRVRRVNPPEPERAALRAGQHAPFRMATPMSLVEVLKRKLPVGNQQKSTNLAATPSNPTVAPPAAAALPGSKASASDNDEREKAEGNPDFDTAFTPHSPPGPIASAPVEPAVTTQVPPKPVVAKQDKTQTKDKPQAKAEPKVPVEKPATSAPAAKTRGFVVQAGAFSTQERADRVAKAIGGKVSRAEKFFLVRTGPFSSKEEAHASLAKVKAAGYSDARIYSGS